jgi:hypothetical protein
MGKSERLYRTSKIVRKRIPFLEKMYNQPFPVGDIPEKRIGQCRDRHPYDCGRTKCYACHCDKLDNIPTIQERRSALDYKEYLQ